MSKNRRRPHRGRREKKKKAGMLSNIILIVALVVFCVSAFQLVKIVGGYAKGRDEYKKIQSIALNNEKSEPEQGFSVNFDELNGINPDTIGWIRFYPEPSIINYPIVQTTDNEKYLTELGEFLSTLKNVKALDILPYHNMAISKYERLGINYKLKDTPPLSHNDAIKARDLIIKAMKNALNKK